MAADAALIIGSVWLVASETYLAVLHPRLLPEGKRLMGTSPRVAFEELPCLAAWPDHVFDVLGESTAIFSAIVPCPVGCQAPPR